MKIIKDFILRNIAGEYVLIPTGTTTQEFNGLISLNEIAAFIWNNIENVDDVDDMVKLILEEYEIDEMTAKIDVENFLAGLKESNIIN